jgi:hypothetical protein
LQGSLGSGKRITPRIFRVRLFRAAERAHLHVDLRPVERGVADAVVVVYAAAVEHAAQQRLGPAPGRVVVHELVPRVARVAPRQAETHAVDAEQRVDLGVHVEHGVELALELLRRAVDVPVVHAHAAHARET